MSSTAPRLAVCSWSLQPTSADDLIEKVIATGVPAVQLALEPLLEGGSWQGTPEKLRAAGIAVVSGMMGCVGEDYTTIKTIEATGGIMPDATWPATLANMKQGAVLAGKLGLKLVTFHAGFIPHDATSAGFKKGVARVREIAALFAAQGSKLAMETGQEPAAALLEFLSALSGTGVGVNFDPANMLLYGSGAPIPALKALMPHVHQVHVKDAIASAVPGQWGGEVPVGTGQVPWAEFFGVLKSANYTGHLAIEREAGQQRTTDIRTARDLVLSH